MVQKKFLLFSFVTAMVLILSKATNASYMIYGDQDVLGTGTYSSDPTQGAVLEGLLPGQVTYSSVITRHSYPFDPSTTDFPGTDQIYVGSAQTAQHDGYSYYDGRANGPQVFTLDYSSLVPDGHRVDTFTLGIAADDFQYPRVGNPYEAYVNGVFDPDLTNVLNSLDQSGPNVQFFTLGINPALLTSDNILLLSIDQGGDGGDGWAIDYLSVGVTTSPVPIPPSALLLVGGLAGLIGVKRKDRK